MTTPLSEWTFGFGGWDGEAEATHGSCRKEIRMTPGMPVSELLSLISLHDCSSIDQKTPYTALALRHDPQGER